MRKEYKPPEIQPLRYDYQLTREALENRRREWRIWKSDYTLSRFELLAILFAIVAPAVFVWWRLG